MEESNNSKSIGCLFMALLMGVMGFIGNYISGGLEEGLNSAGIMFLSWTVIFGVIIFYKKEN